MELMSNFPSTAYRGGVQGIGEGIETRYVGQDRADSRSVHRSLTFSFSKTVRKLFNLKVSDS